MQMVFLNILTLAVLCLAGGYHVFVSAAVSAVLLGFLVFCLIRNKELYIRMSLLTLALFIFSLMHFLVYFWAIDPSMTLKGGVKFLPVFLLWLCLAQLNTQEKEKWLGMFPVYGTVITLVSLVLTTFPAGRELVMVEGRLGGTFQYPNTYAMFLLACTGICLFRVYGRFASTGTSQAQEQTFGEDRSVVQRGASRANRSSVQQGISGANRSVVQRGASRADESTIWRGASGANKSTVQQRASGADLSAVPEDYSGARGSGKLPETAVFFLDLVQIAVCAAGIALSGSRTVYLLTAAVILFSLCFLLFSGKASGRTNREEAGNDGAGPDVSGGKNRTGRDEAGRSAAGSYRGFAAAAGGLLLILILVFAFTGAGDLVMERISAISLRSSTLLGRFLYAKDAIPILSDHPAGLGFYGYRFLQGTYQTGNYAVVNAHNELLQMMLDIGILPGILLLAAGLFSFFREPYKFRNRFLILLLLVHALADYDFHFLSIWFLFLLMLPSDGNRVLRSSASGKAAAVTAGVVSIGLLYFCVRIGVSDLYYVTGRNAASQKWHPNTVSALNILAEHQITDEERGELADKILEQDEYVSAAYAVKAEQAIIEANAIDMAVYQKAAIRTNPYRFGLYTDYLEMLYETAKIYRENGDQKSAHACGALAAEIPQLLKQVEERTSRLGWNLSVKPTVTLDEDHEALLEELLTY